MQEHMRSIPTFQAAEQRINVTINNFAILKGISAKTTHEGQFTVSRWH